MTDTIYALYYTLDGKKDYFYVGRTIDLERRMKQHLGDAIRGGTETSRQFIRDLLTAKLSFDHEVLAEVTSAEQHYEQYYAYVKLCEGYTLTNMRNGDARQAAYDAASDLMFERGDRYAGPKEFLEAREREVAEAKARAKTAKLNAKKAVKESDVDKMLYSFERPTKFTAPAFEALAKRKRR